MTRNVWKYLSNLWDSFADKGLFEKVWEAYEDVMQSVRSRLFEVNLAKSIDFIEPAKVLEWSVFLLNEHNLVSEGVYSIVGSGTIEIDKIQDGIDEPENIYYHGVDYTISGTELTWLSITEENPVPVDIELWAVDARVYGTQVYDNFGILVGEEAADSGEYLNMVKGLMHAYWMGPEIRHIRNGLNIILRGPFFEETGTVSFVDEINGVVKSNLPDGEIKEYSVPPGAVSVWKVGDSVGKFDLITNTVEVLDYIKDPTWWNKFGISSLDINAGVVGLTPDAEAALNHISKRFVWAIKIDADSFAGVDGLVAGAIERFLTNIEPSYTNHSTILANDFYSGDGGDYLSFSDDEDNNDLEIEVEIGLSETVSFNEVSTLMYAEYAANNLGYHDYHSEAEPAYNIDNDILLLTEELDILET